MRRNFRGGRHQGGATRSHVYRVPWRSARCTYSVCTPGVLRVYFVLGIGTMYWPRVHIQRVEYLRQVYRCTCLRVLRQETCYLSHVDLSDRLFDLDGLQSSMYMHTSVTSTALWRPCRCSRTQTEQTGTSCLCRQI